LRGEAGKNESVAFAFEFGVGEEGRGLARGEEGAEIEARVTVASRSRGQYSDS